MEQDNNKKVYRLEDQILVEVRTVYKASLSELNICPSSTSEARIKQKVLEAIDDQGLGETRGLQAIISHIALLRNSAVTKSTAQPEDKDEDEI